MKSLNIVFSLFLEHTTGLCKSYEDKHNALQEKLRESSLRCEYSTKDAQNKRLLCIKIVSIARCKWW